MKRLPAGLALGLVVTAPATAKEQYIYGPPPDWSRYKELAEAGVRAQLPDSASWSIEWPNGYIPFVWDHKGDFGGYLTCGVMRAIAPVEKRHPLTNFVVVVDQDRVKTVDISTRESNSLINTVCESWSRKGKLPPAALMEKAPIATGASSPAPITSDPHVAKLGLTIRPMPEGAYVIAAASGSPGAAAGLKPGMVVTRVNGIALGELGPAMVPLLASAAAELTLETAAGERIVLKPLP